MPQFTGFSERLWVANPPMIETLLSSSAWALGIGAVVLVVMGVMLTRPQSTLSPMEVELPHEPASADEPEGSR
jgi:hypothetical protein